MATRTSPSTTMKYGEEPPIKRSRSFLMLPDDLILNCLARVSRLHYPTLSLVSKKFRFLLASTELYETRKLLGCTESCLYVCLRRPIDPKLHWFILCHRPKSSRKVLVPISSPTSTSASPPSDCSVVVVGPDIYAIGGRSKTNGGSSSVMVMDSRSHTWHEAPSMRVARLFPSPSASACTLDGKIYVVGGSDNLDSMNWMEIFDTKTQTWEFLQIPSEEVCGSSRYRSIGYEGTVYVTSENNCGTTYKLHKGRWRAADICIDLGWRRSSTSCYVVIENVFYRCNGENIIWYDLKNRVWKPLKGLPSLPFPGKSVKVADHFLADHGGKMAIFWEDTLDDKRVIHYAEIAIEKHQNMEIWGKVEWFDNVFTCLDGRFRGNFMHALVATVW